MCQKHFDPKAKDAAAASFAKAKLAVGIFCPAACWSFYNVYNGCKIMCLISFIALSLQGMMPNNMAPMSPEKPGSPYFPFSKRPGMEDSLRGVYVVIQ